MRKLLYIVIAAFFFSCSPEYYIEKTFEQSIPEISLMLLFPDELDAVNTKSGLDLQRVSDEVYDSIFYAADFLPHIWRDTFLTAFRQNLIQEFRSTGFKVYNEQQWSEFLSLEGPSYIVNITYLQLEERYTAHAEYTYPNKDRRNKKVENKSAQISVNLLNTIGLNAWIDYQFVQDTSKNTYSFFTYSELTDSLKSKQIVRNGNPVITVFKDSLSLEEALQLQYTSPPDIRNHIVDFMVNQTMERYIGVHYYRYPHYYLIFDGKGNLNRSAEAPQYDFLKVE